MSPAFRTRHNRSLLLAVILGAYLMIILDTSIVITALPSIHRDLHFSATGLSWVQNAYTLTFGGLLLLGARAGDLLGRRRLFSLGIGLFTVASMAGGLAPSADVLLIARALQGIGAAIAAPAALALLTTSFPEGPERGRAVALYTAVAGGGGSVGLVLGGMLTEWASWRWGLFINVPVGAALLWLGPRVLPETPRRTGHFDFTGAITSTLGMTSLVYGFVRAAADGWSNTLTIASFVVSGVFLAGFLAAERRAKAPVVPLRLFASRERSGAFLARALVVSGMFGMFFFVTQFLQGVLGFSPLQAGVAFLPTSAVLFAATQIVPRLAGRMNDVRLIATGVSLALIGMVWLSRLSEGTHYFPQLAIPMALLGAGIGTALTPLTGAGIRGVAPEDAGAASGLVNVSQQIGASLGLSILITLFASASHTSADTGPRLAFANGVGTALTGSAVFLALGLAVVFVALRPRAGKANAVEPSFGELDLDVDLAA
jgi:EmrB/QacA subfamily drug resistance transporter